MDNYKFHSYLIKEEKTSKYQMNNYDNLSLEQIEERERLDNTDNNLISAKMNKNKTNQLLFKNFDILSKEKLLEYNIIKKFSNKESYFYFLDYISGIEILPNLEKINKSSDKKDTKNKLKIPNIIINFFDGKMNIKKSLEKREEYVEKSEFEYGEMLLKKNINIDNIFVMKEKITIEKLREKINNYLNCIIFMEEKNTNFPNFQSELFFHYQLENVFETFQELNDKKFLKKINMIKMLQDFIKKVKNNEIRDRTILNYFFFIIDVEYKLDKYIKRLINEYSENNHFYQDAYVNQIENKLIIKNSDKVINNFDYFNLNEKDI